MVVSLRGLSGAFLAASVCLVAALPAAAQNPSRIVDVITSDGAPVRLKVPLAGAGNGDPGGGRGSIRITGLQGMVGIPLYAGTSIDAVVDMSNIAHVEDSVPRYSLTHAGTELRSAREMYEVLRPTFGFGSTRSACVLLPGGTSQLVGEFQATLPANSGPVRTISLLPTSTGFSSSHVVAGISWCMRDSTTAAIVIGLVGFEESLLERMAIEGATQAGVVVYAPAMSMEHQAEDSVAVPGVYSAVKAIGAVERDGKLAWWSPLSREVDFVAPAQFAASNAGVALTGGQHLALGALMYGIGTANLSAYLDGQRPGEDKFVQRSRLESALGTSARSLPGALDRRYSGNGVADFVAAQRQLAYTGGRHQVLTGLNGKAVRNGADIEIRATWQGGAAALEVYQNDLDRVTVIRNRNEATFVVRNAGERGVRSLRLCNVGQGGECGYVHAAWGPQM